MRTVGTLFLAVLVGLVFAATSFAGIATTAHDLSLRTNTAHTDNLGPGTIYGNLEICVYCHTPHQADTTVTEAPLWNMAVTSATYTSYDSSTFDGTMASDNLAGPSRLCMSCHDGTIAVDNALTGDAGGVGGVGTNYIAPGKLIGGGGTLAGDHPVGFSYATAGAEIHPATTVYAGATIADFLYDDGLIADIMTCATCHDVHNDDNGSFLLVKNDSSDLCLTCHDK